MSLRACRNGDTALGSWPNAVSKHHLLLGSTVMSDATSMVEFRDIQGFPGYRVGSDGSVWCCLGRGGLRGRITAAWRPIKSRIDFYGYPYVSLAKSGRYFSRKVHTLVIRAFVGPAPSGMECCHWDGDPKNCALSNLRWDTHASNFRDMVRHGRSCRGEKNTHCRLTERDVIEIRRLCAKGDPRSEIAAKYKIHPAHVSAINRGRFWSWLTTKETNE